MKNSPPAYWLDDKVKIIADSTRTIVTEVSVSNWIFRYILKGKGKKLYEENELELIEHDASYFKKKFIW